MRLHYQHLIPVFLLTLAALPACTDKEGETEGASQTMTEASTGSTGSTSTTGETAEPMPTTGDSTTGTGTTTEDSADTGTTDPTGGEVESDPALYASCKAALDNMLLAQTAECECDVMAGEFPDLATCLGGDPDSRGDYCPCEVYARHPESKASIDCLATGAAAYASCNEAAVCSDPDAFDACGGAFFMALFQCEQASEALQAELDASCGGVGGEDGFTCGSGEQVPVRWRCDGEPDCDDGSDEQDCG